MAVQVVSSEEGGDDNTTTVANIDDDTVSILSTTTTATDAVPLLTSDTSSASSIESARTDMASSILGEGYVLESEDGVLTIPNRYREHADLLCPFQILDCDHTFADIRDFKLHVFSHFRGHVLPMFAACFLCDNKYTQRAEDDPALAWNNMLSHMVHDHFRQGQQLATVRTDFALMSWMYRRRIISDHQYKRTQLIPIPTLLPGGVSNAQRSETAHLVGQAPRAPVSAPTPAAILAQMSQSVGLQNEAYTVNAGRRTERRRRDATRTMVRARSIM